MEENIRTNAEPKVVIIGGGFGGLACADKLGGAAIDVTVIDRRNHNLFQPLLYQVATAALSPADIAEPIRKTLGRHPNIKVELGTVTGIIADHKLVVMAGGRMVPYDFLVLATGSDYNYFGNNAWRDLAPGLKSLREARQIRQRLLGAFERAELTNDPNEKRALLTSVIIGGGPTGVEMAGAISELGRFMIARDFRNIAPEHLRVVLVEASPRILGAFPQALADYAENYLRNIGVDILKGERVTAIGSQSVSIGASEIPCSTVIWGAGIKASEAAQWLDLNEDPLGRIPVSPCLEVEGFSGIYALGDTALSIGSDGKPLPALAQVAKQQGAYLGKNLKRLIEQGERPRPFVFENRGNTAVIGRHAAIFDFGSWQMKGRFAWFLWALVHVYLLINFEKRVLVSIQWISRYLTRQRGARIIDETSKKAD